jgi:ubiquinone/menaquinone biosynthesis C-methylase UbiE
MADPDGAGRTRAGVRETYDHIATHFSKTRANPWPETETFLEGRAGGLGLDVGCGNGRNAEVLAGHADRVLALDASRGMLATARERVPGVALCQGDAARLPVASDAVRTALYVATLHHLPDRETRRASLSELGRVLAPGGRALVSAWATAHDRFDADPEAETGFDTTLDWTLPDGETVPRFYHIYAPAEFERDLAASGATVERSWVSSGNCYAVLSE